VPVFLVDVGEIVQVLIDKVALILAQQVPVVGDRAVQVLVRHACNLCFVRVIGVESGEWREVRKQKKI